MAFYEKRNGEYVRVPSGGASVYIGPDKPTNGALYWLDTSGDVVPPDVPVVTLTGITVAYSGGDVTVGTAVTDLTGVVVTAHYSDGSTQAVTEYTLSGTIAEGSNTVTVTYQGKTATFTVTGIAESGGEEPDEPEKVTYAITNNLTNVTSNNAAASVEENASYTATLTAANGYELDTVTVTMGDTDVTADVYADGVVTISAVTGNVVITATATVASTDVDFSEENVYTSAQLSNGKAAITFGKTTSPTWEDFMALEAEKLYFYFVPYDGYKKQINIGASFNSGWGSVSIADSVSVEQATSGTYDFVTNAWDKYSESGYVVFEIDVAALQTKVQTMYDDGTLDSTKEKVVSVQTKHGASGGSMAYMLYNYNE